MLADLNADQKSALKILKGSANIFLTGEAGSGKSFLLRSYLKDQDIPILASTGAAAILVGGRTFHSFFGLGILEGGLEATVSRALKNKLLCKRLKKTSAVVIDEVSMISGPTLRAAETIRRVGGSMEAWGVSKKSRLSFYRWNSKEDIKESRSRNQNSISSMPKDSPSSKQETSRSGLCGPQPGPLSQRHCPGGLVQEFHFYRSPSHAISPGTELSYSSMNFLRLLSSFATAFASPLTNSKISEFKS